MKFDNLGLAPTILETLQEKGYTQATPIQQQVIPEILKGQDILASAQTGSGKTAGFTLPILQILSGKPATKKRQIKALILSPTRELAHQINDSIIRYSKRIDIKSTVIFGGVNQKAQVRALTSGVDILIATPGRLLDLYGQKFVSLKFVEFMVLDEADRMLDMGFQPDLQKIIKLLPTNRQNMLFSATFPKEIKLLARKLLSNPITVEIEPTQEHIDAIEQKVYLVSSAKRSDLIINIIKEGNWLQVLVFSRTKHGADKLCKKMIKANIDAIVIHGNKSQSARSKALNDFKKGKNQVLIATDIASRGIDIPLLPYVINYDLPDAPEDYIHRVGRTGRAGAKGLAISLVAPSEKSKLKSIEKLVNLTFPREIKENFEVDEKLFIETETTKRGRKRKKKTSLSSEQQGDSEHTIDQKRSTRRRDDRGSDRRRDDRSNVRRRDERSSDRRSDDRSNVRRRDERSSDRRRDERGSDRRRDERSSDRRRDERSSDRRRDDRGSDRRRDERSSDRRRDDRGSDRRRDERSSDRRRDERGSDRRRDERGSDRRRDERGSDRRRDERVATAGAMTEVATAGAMKEVATAGAMTEVATAGAMKEVATAGAMKEVATAGAMTEVATANAMKEVATAGATKEIAITDLSEESIIKTSLELK